MKGSSRAALKSGRAIPNPKPEDRRPKSEVRRPPFGFRVSGFGFQIATPADQQLFRRA